MCGLLSWLSWAAAQGTGRTRIRNPIMKKPVRIGELRFISIFYWKIAAVTRTCTLRPRQLRAKIKGRQKSGGLCLRKLSRGRRDYLLGLGAVLCAELGVS